ncbi:hypothetical protein B0H14DRAFT_3428866 [Mycena olivaceomarginata]|nr:hypothetical protein B0H14DRAFT_3428866 [Mycena olivaceomarginata]
MASKHAPDDQKLIDSLSMGIMSHDGISKPNLPTRLHRGQPHLFINNDWFDAVQLRAFLKNMIIHPDDSVPARTKVEYEASDASGMCPSAIPNVRVRVLTEGTQEVLEILSDSENTLGSPRVSPTNLCIPRLTVLPLLQMPASHHRFPHLTFDVGHGRRDFASRGDSESATAADLDGYFSSDELEVSSRVRIGEFQVMAEATVERVEYLTELPPLYPIPETPTAFVIDLQDPKFNITKNRTMCTVDALIKPKYDNDSWKGNTGTRDSHVWVSFEPGAEPILRRQSRLNCKGAMSASALIRLLNVVWRDLDPTSRDTVFAAQCQTRRDEGTTAECKVTQ